MCRFGVIVVIAVATLSSTCITSAQQAATTAVPNLIRYGGTLKDGNGAAIATTTGVTFAIYKQQDGGAPVWMETQNVSPDDGGNYSVLLGSTTATGLPSDLFSQGEQRWLGVQVQEQAEQPRVLLVSVPYALKAHEAEMLGGKSVSDFVLAKDLNSTSSAAGIASSSGAGIASSSGSGSSQAALAKGNKSPSNLAASQGPTNFSGSTTDQIVGVTQTGTGAGINASAGTTAIAATATATSGATFGMKAIALGPGGIGVLGNADARTGATVGVKGGSVSTSGTGVRGLDTATTGNTTGISAYVASPAGTAGVFNNAAGGKIISGQNNGLETFSVDGSGMLSVASLLASGIVDGKAPVTVTTRASCTLGTAFGCATTAYNSGYTFNQEATAATAITYTLPTAAAGKQYCVGNSYNGSNPTTGTLEILTGASGQYIIFTDGTLSANNGYVISGGAAGDAACVVGVDSTHWMLYVERGTWTKH